MNKKEIDWKTLTKVQIQKSNEEVKQCHFFLHRVQRGILHPGREYECPHPDCVVKQVHES